MGFDLTRLKGTGKDSGAKVLSEWDDAIKSVYGDEATAVGAAPVPEDPLKQLSDFDAGNKEFLDEWAGKQKELGNLGRDPLKAAEFLKYNSENRGKYGQLMQKRNELKAAVDNYQDPEEKVIGEQLAGIRESIDKGLRAAYADYDSRQNNFRKEHPFLYALSGARKSTVSDMPALESREFGNLSAAKDLIDDSEKLIKATGDEKEGSFGGGVVRGFRDGVFDIDTWSMGITDAMKNTSLMLAADKAEKGEKLTEDEDQLLTAAALNMAVQQYYGSKLGRGYKSGQTAANSIPFMLEIIANPASGAGKGIAKTLAKYGLKKLGKAAGRVAGDVAASVAMTGTTGAVGTVADAIARHTGEVQYDTDGNGVKYAGHVGGEGWPSAISKAAGARTIENFSEMFGEYFSPVGKFIAGSRPMKALGASKIGKLIDNIGSTDWAKAVKNIEENARWHGVMGEYGEEVVGTILNSLTVGDNELSDVFDMDQQIDTFLGVSLLGGFFSGIKTAGYLGARKKAAEKMAGLEEDVSGIVGEKWEEIKEGFDTGDSETANSIVKEVLKDKGYSLEQKAAVLDYVKGRMEYEGTLKADRKKEEEEDNRLQQETGGYVNSVTGNVEVAEDKEGNTVYMLGETPDGDHKMYILNRGGEKITVSREDFGEEYKVKHAVSKQEFLEGLISEKELLTVEDGSYALLKDGRQCVVENTPDGLVADFLDGQRENITPDMIERPISDEEWFASQQEEVQPEAVENPTVPQPEAGDVMPAAQEALPGDVQQPQRQIPLTEDGKPDYNAMSPEMFAEEFEKEFGPEDTKSELEQMAADIDTRVEKLQKKAPTDRNARAENKREILRLTKEKESVLQALERYATEEKVPEKNAEVIPDYSAEPEITEPEKVEVANEIDDNGLPFVSSSNGSTIFGNITEETGLTVAPIKLSKGFNKKDKNGRNIGYGLQHIEESHGEQIRLAGFKSIEEFVESVSNSFTVIRKGGNRKGNNTFLLEVSDEKNNTLFVELSKDGTYWNVNSAGIFRKGYSKNKEVVWSLPAVETSSTAEDDGVRNNDKSDNSMSGNSPQTISTENKDTNIQGEKQDGNNENTIYPEESHEDVSDNILFREVDNYTPEEDIEEVNRRFNEELGQQVDGKLPKGHVYQLGRPSNFLRKAGIPDLPIEMPASQLAYKSSSGKHDYDLSEVMNLPEAITSPIATFSYGDKGKSQNILTILEHNGENFLVGMFIRPTVKGKVLEVNSIRNVFPKNTDSIVKWILDGKLTNANKEKLLNFLDQQRTDYADVAFVLPDEQVKQGISEVSTATNIVENFENPTLQAGEISAGIAQLSDELGVPVKKVPGRKELPEGIQRQMRGGRYPGLFDPKSGEVYMVMDEITDVADAQATMLHEIIGHKGIRGLFGKDLPGFCKQVMDSMNETEREKWLKRFDGDEQLAAEEYVASFAEGYSDPSAWQKVKAIVKDFFRKLGIDLKLSDNDLKYILWKAKNGLKEGDGMLEVAEKIAKSRDIEQELWRKEEDDNSIEEVNRRFNGELLKFTVDNADKTIFNIGKPSDVLISAGVENKPIKLYGSKVLKKMKKHGFDAKELKDLPKAVADPIAVFNNLEKQGNRSILTELKTAQGNFLVTIDLGKGHDADFDVVSSLFGKNNNSVITWINKDFATYINKEKALEYLHLSAPIAEASNTQELSSVTNIIQNFENPKFEDEIRFREVAGEEEDGMQEITERIAKGRSVERELWRKEEGDSSIEEVNRRFNEELERYKAGQMGKNDVFHLGKPRGILKDFLPDLDIIMFQRTVKKGIEKKHNVGIEAMSDMPSELCKPIFIFQRDDHTLGILTEMKDQDNRNVCVAIEMKKKVQDGKSFLEVNELTSFHGRRSENVIFPILKNKTLKWVDKEKGLDWISSVNPNESQEISNQDLSSATNIIQNFENPKFEDEIRFREVSEEEGERNKEAAERISLLSGLQSQLLNERVSARLIARKLAGYARNAFGKDLVEAMGKKDFDTVVKEIERGVLESKLPEESAGLTDERERLIQEYWKNLGDREASGKTVKRIREIDQEVNRMAKEALWEPMMRIGDVVATLELKRQNERLNRLVNLKVDGMNTQGVSIAKKVDEDTKLMLHFIRDHIGEDMTGKIEELKKKRDEAENGGRKFSREDEVTLKAAEALQQFFASDNSHEVIKEYEGRIKELKGDIKELEGRIEEEKQKENPDKRLLARLRRKVKNKKQEIRYSAFTVIDDRYKLSQKMIKLNDLVEEMIYEGRSSFLDRVNEESIRRAEILREAMRDMDTRTEEQKANPIDRKKTRGDKVMDFIRKYPLSPAWSFSYLVKHLSRNAMNGEGEFYDHMFKAEDGLLEASAKEWKGLQEFRTQLDGKAKEIFGKKYDYLKVMKESGKMLEGVSLTVNTGTSGEYEFHPTTGQALYITMIDRMPDAAQKLRAYGISDENVMDLRNALPEEYVRFADWVQDEFLPRKRKKYNETHLRVFGASMAEINHYFPLRVQKSDVYQKADLNKPSDSGLPSGITGSIINRKPNWLIPDVHTNAFEILLEHGKEMEHWNAYTRVVHDLNGVLSSTAFRKMLKDRDENLPERFRSAATIAVGEYRVKDDDWNKRVNTVAKGFTAAKINFRMNTALKQVFSGPAFMAYAADADYQKRLAHYFMPWMQKKNWKWGMKNLPVFEKRWKERKVGNEKLEDGTWIDKFTNSKGIKAGMWLNAAIDAMTCVNGARAVYDYKLKQYKALGIAEAEAVRRARIDAELAFNESQQSAEGFMLSKLQKDKTVLAAGLSVFNNSNFLYLRQTLEGVDELRRDMDKEVASRKRLLMKLGVEEKVAEDAALKEVRRMHRTAIAKIGVFGFGLQVIWNLGSKAVPYITALMVLGFGDDDKEKEEAREVLRNAGDEMLKSLLIAPVRNLPGGSDIESMLNGFEASFGDLPMFSDLSKLLRMYKKCIENGEIDLVTLYETFRMAGEGAAGIDVDVLTNLCLGIEDVVKGGRVRVEDTGLWISAPASSVRELAKRRRADETMEEYIKRIRDLNVANRIMNRTPAWLKSELTDRYKLTPFERARKEVLQDTKKEINRARKDESLSPAEKRERRESLIKERDERIEELKEKYEVVH